MSFSLPTKTASAAQLVEYLADPHRYALAYERLIMDPGRIPALMAALRDPAEVRVQALHALEFAARGDPSPAVRKKASWFAPGGTVYRRTAPRITVRRPWRGWRPGPVSR